MTHSGRHIHNVRKHGKRDEPTPCVKFSDFILTRFNVLWNPLGVTIRLTNNANSDVKLCLRPLLITKDLILHNSLVKAMKRRWKLHNVLQYLG